ncbi:MAG: UDP-N-acetylmuramoyl-L-alanine--D-glutamate ligase [Phycisphaerae bacterium]|nr:UDP-N-acetylmuramoyl-L-alanine--D-glutamate ligase [Phycisphaerae bacterium]
MENNFWSGRKVLVMGLGRFGGGLDSAKFVACSGAEVTVTDIQNADDIAESLDGLSGFGGIKYHLGGHVEKDFEQADIVIVNPAVLKNNKYLKIAKENGAAVTTQINIFLEKCPALLIGITGSNGKSTTAALTYHILKGAEGNKGVSYRKAWLGGNIGDRPLLCVLDQIQTDDVVVLELSSFQTDYFDKTALSTHMALLTNLTPNHIDRHGSFQDYCEAKEKLFTYQRIDPERRCGCFFCRDDRIGTEWHNKYKQLRECNFFCGDDLSDKIKKGFKLVGRANLNDLAGAAAIAKSLGINDEIINVSEFKPLSHRLEFVLEADGVRWYNDSKSTTPQSLCTAIESFDSPVILIAGGYDKGVSFDQMGAEIAKRCKTVILMGQTAKSIEKAIVNAPDSAGSNVRIHIAGDMAEAVCKARQDAEFGDCVVLSPGCASYDMFDNYQQRGAEFVRMIKGLK